ncbi:MAG: hypothetical protein AAGB48_07090 [Planctomycetota bacterium]
MTPARLPRLAPLAALGLTALLLTACAPGRTVILTNDTATPVRATVSRELIQAGDRRLAGATVGPGETATLGPVSAPITERVTLAVDSAIGLGSGVTETRRLGWGTTRLRIGPDDFSPSGLVLIDDE